MDFPKESHEKSKLKRSKALQFESETEYQFFIRRLDATWSLQTLYLLQDLRFFRFVEQEAKYEVLQKKKKKSKTKNDNEEPQATN